MGGRHWPSCVRGRHYIYCCQCIKGDLQMSKLTKSARRLGYACTAATGASGGMAGLKLTGAITLPWWLVFAPLVAVVVAVAVFYALAFLILSGDGQ